MFKLKGTIAGAIALAVLSSLIYVAPTKAELKSNLIVEVDGLKNQTGEICLKLFGTSAGFPDNNERAVKRQCVKIAENPPTIVLKDIPSGSYAISLFQDLNGDHKLNRGSTGIPIEGYGFSNNPATRQDLTRYGDCVFLLAGSSNTLKIKLEYAAKP